MNLSNSEISNLVKRKLRPKEMTLKKCCEDFNNKYFKEIESEALSPLNKDFVSRVARNDFKVCSDRVVKLCEFLDIRASHGATDQLRILSDQISEFDRQAVEDADFKTKYSAIAKFLSGLNLENMLGRP